MSRSIIHSWAVSSNIIYHIALGCYSPPLNNRCNSQVCFLPMVWENLFKTLLAAEWPICILQIRNAGSSMCLETKHFVSGSPIRLETCAKGRGEVSWSHGQVSWNQCLSAFNVKVPIIVTYREMWHLFSAFNPSPVGAVSSGAAPPSNNARWYF